MGSKYNPEVHGYSAHPDSLPWANPAEATPELAQVIIAIANNTEQLIRIADALDLLVARQPNW